MAVESQLDNNYDRLHDFVNQEDLWKRQVRASKEYKWSQQAVKHGIKEGARRHHEMNTLLSTVNSVKLMQDEQNSTQQILDLLNEGDYQIAINRLERLDFSRRLKLSILLIHDLTLGTLKDVYFKKDACFRLIQVVSTIKDESLNWSEYYPLSVMYFIHVELANINLDSSPIWNKGDYNLSTLLDFKNSKENKKLTKLELLESIKETKLLIIKYKKQLKAKSKLSREYASLTKEIEYQNLEIKLAEKKIDDGNFRKEESLLLESIDVNTIKEINLYTSDIYNRLDTYFLILENHFNNDISEDTKYKSVTDSKYNVECYSIDGDEVIDLIQECLEFIPKDIKLYFDEKGQYGNKKESRYINYRVRLASLLYKQSNLRNEIFKNIKKWYFLASYNNLSSILNDSSQLEFFDQLKFLTEISLTLSEAFIYHAVDEIISLANGLVEKTNIHDNSITFAYYHLSNISINLLLPVKAYEYTQIAVNELEELVSKHKKILQDEIRQIDEDEKHYGEDANDELWRQNQFKKLCKMPLAKLEGRIDADYASKNIGNVSKLYVLCVYVEVELLKMNNSTFTDRIKKLASSVVNMYNELILEGDKEKIENNLLFIDHLKKTIKELSSDGFFDVAKSIQTTFTNKEIDKDLNISDLIKEVEADKFQDLYNNLVSYILSSHFNVITYNEMLNSLAHDESFDFSKQYLIVTHLVDKKYYDIAIELISNIQDKKIHNDAISTVLHSLSSDPDSVISSAHISLLISYLEKPDVVIENRFKVCISLSNFTKLKKEKQNINKSVLELIGHTKNLQDTLDFFKIENQIQLEYLHKELFLDSLRNKLLTQIDQITKIDELKNVKECLGDDVFRLNVDSFQDVAQGLLIKQINPLNIKDLKESINESISNGEFPNNAISFDGLYDIYILCLEFECFDLAGLCYTLILDGFPEIFNIYESIFSNRIIMINSYDRKFEIDFDTYDLEIQDEIIDDLFLRFKEFGLNDEVDELKYIISDYENIWNGYDEEYFELAMLDAKRGLLDSALSNLEDMQLDSIKDLSIYYISKILISKNDLRSISKLIKMVKHDYFKSLILLDVSIHFYESGDSEGHISNLEACIKLVNSIYSQWRKDSILLKVYNFFFELGKHNEAEVYRDKIVLPAYNISAEFIFIEEKLKNKGQDSKLFSEFKQKAKSIELNFDTNLLQKLESINSPVVEEKILQEDELDDLIKNASESFLSDMTIEIREQIRLCKKHNANDKLLFILNKLEPYRYIMNDSDFGIRKSNVIILLAELYYVIGDNKKLDRILLNN
jgi:hypothetical protein